jgi:hypothetical protein
MNRSPTTKIHTTVVRGQSAQVAAMMASPKSARAAATVASDGRSGPNQSSSRGRAVDEVEVGQAARLVRRELDGDLVDALVVEEPTDRVAIDADSGGLGHERTSPATRVPCGAVEFERTPASADRIARPAVERFNMQICGG